MTNIASVVPTPDLILHLVNMLTFYVEGIFQSFPSLEYGDHIAGYVILPARDILLPLADTRLKGSTVFSVSH